VWARLGRVSVPLPCQKQPTMKDNGGHLGDIRAAPELPTRSSRGRGRQPDKDEVVGLADVAPALGNCEDQVLFPENGQGAARGRACHLVRLGDLRFGDPAARGQLARADLVADDLRNLEVGGHRAGGIDLGHAMIVMARYQLLRA
jgi:hypothetical protein